MSDYLTTEQVAALLVVNPRTVRNMVARGDLPAYKLAGSSLVRYKREDVEALFLPHQMR